MSQGELSSGLCRGRFTDGKNQRTRRARGPAAQGEQAMALPTYVLNIASCNYAKVA